MIGSVLVPPAVRVTEPWLLRNPLAVARTVYVPAGAFRLNVPFVFAVTEVTSVLVESYKPTVTGLPARTCPVSIPRPPGVCVAVGVEDPVGVEVSVGVDVSAVAVEVGVGDPAGVVGVDVGNVSHAYVETICPKTADSTA